MYIVKKDLQENTEYGLLEQLRIVAMQINAEGESIIIDWNRVVVAPTGKVVQILEIGQYTKTNDGTSQEYTDFQASDVGQAIQDLLTSEYLQESSARLMATTVTKKKSK